ncbi:hypothetical protein AgCh_025847 [Apium graveolens]
MPVIKLRSEIWVRVVAAWVHAIIGHQQGPNTAAAFFLLLFVRVLPLLIHPLFRYPPFIKGFSYVFSVDSSQDDVFDKMVNPIVEDIMKGKSGMLAALGPSGSGKAPKMFLPPSKAVQERRAIWVDDLVIRLMITQPVSRSGLRCRTSASTPVSAPGSPKLQCKTAKNSPIFQRSNPSSPKSPSTFSLLRSTLRLSKPDLKVYNDDEPMMSPTSIARFNPIPELDENEDEDNESNCQEF